MTFRAISLAVLAIAARSATGAGGAIEVNDNRAGGATEVNGDMAILELKRLQEEGQQALVDALLQGTTALAIGHAPDGIEFAEHIASFELAASGSSSLWKVLGK